MTKIKVPFWGLIRYNIIAEYGEIFRRFVWF